MSARYPGLLWTFNDSGHPPELFATDTLGRDHGSLLVTGAANVDWEAASFGACGDSLCVYLGDTGDNLEHRSRVQLYRLAEPSLEADLPMGRTGAAARSLTVRYPDGSHDVEAMFVTGDGDVFLITKGLLGRVQLFRVDARAWAAGAVEAKPKGTLPIDTGRDLGSLVTDAALRRGSRDVVVRTYREIYAFTLSSGGELELASSNAVCSLAGLEPQGEGIAWLDDTTLVLTSERGGARAGTISVVRPPGR